MLAAEQGGATKAYLVYGYDEERQRSYGAKNGHYGVARLRQGFFEIACKPSRINS